MWVLHGIHPSRIFFVSMGHPASHMTTFLCDYYNRSFQSYVCESVTRDGHSNDVGTSTFVYRIIAEATITTRAISIQATIAKVLVLLFVVVIDNSHMLLQLRVESFQHHHHYYDCINHNNLKFPVVTVALIPILIIDG